MAALLISHTNSIGLQTPNSPAECNRPASLAEISTERKFKFQLPRLRELKFADSVDDADETVCLAAAHNKDAIERMIHLKTTSAHMELIKIHLFQ